MTIETWRKRIDTIDEQLLTLLNERAVCAVEIGKLKKAKSIPLYSPEREKTVIRKLLEKNPGPLDDKSIRTLFERIIDESRHLERITADKQR